jgi:hypothetical protein
VLIRRAQAHELALGKEEVAVPILYVSFPAIMGKSAVGLEREASFDDHVDATDVRDAYLQIALESSRPNDHSQDSLLPRLRAAIDVPLEVAQPFRSRFENSGNLMVRHSPCEKRVVDGRERQPRRLAEQSLRKGIDHAHREFRGIFFVE